MISKKTFFIIDCTLFIPSGLGEMGEGCLTFYTQNMQITYSPGRDDTFLPLFDDFLHPQSNGHN